MKFVHGKSCIWCIDCDTQVSGQPPGALVCLLIMKQILLESVFIGKFASLLSEMSLKSSADFRQTQHAVLESVLIEPWSNTQWNWSAFICCSVRAVSLILCFLNHGYYWKKCRSKITTSSMDELWVIVFWS